MTENACKGFIFLFSLFAMVALPIITGIINQKRLLKESDEMYNNMNVNDTFIKVPQLDIYDIATQNPFNGELYVLKKKALKWMLFKSIEGGEDITIKSTDLHEIRFEKYTGSIK